MRSAAHGLFIPQHALLVQHRKRPLTSESPHPSRRMITVLTHWVHENVKARVSDPVQAAVKPAEASSVR